MSLTDWDPILKSQDALKSDRKRGSANMKDCVEACLRLSDHIDAVNDLNVWLLYISAILQGFGGESGR